MIDLGVKLRRLKYKLKHDFLTIENAVFVLAVFMCLTWTYQSIKAMTRNFELTERLNKERKSLELLAVEVEASELENEYISSVEYQELLARKNANKQLAGEHMVYLPENSEEAKSKHKVVVEKKEEKDYSNFEKWIMYLMPNR